MDCVFIILIMFNQIKYFALLLGVLATPVYADKQPPKDNLRAVYTVRYWDRLMAPDQKKEWRFFAENQVEFSHKIEDICFQLCQRAWAVNRFVADSEIAISNPFPLMYRLYSFIATMKETMSDLQKTYTYNHKGVAYGFDCGSNHSYYFPKCSLHDEEKTFVKTITCHTNIVSKLQEDGKVGNVAGKILNWGEYGSYAGFKEKISTASAEEKEKAYTSLTKLNICNILSFKMDCEKDWVSFGPADFSKNDAGKECVVLSESSKKNNKDNSINIGKRNKIRILYRDSAIEVN